MFPASVQGTQCYLDTRVGFILEFPEGLSAYLMIISFWLNFGDEFVTMIYEVLRVCYEIDINQPSAWKLDG